VEGFRSCTLAKLRWTHQAHLIVGLWHVLNLPTEKTLDEMRQGIMSYNEGDRNVQRPFERGATG
jgi:hypothetical protein